MNASVTKPQQTPQCTWMTSSCGDLRVSNTRLPFLKETHTPLVYVALQKIFWSSYVHIHTGMHNCIHPYRKI